MGFKSLLSMANPVTQSQRAENLLFGDKEGQRQETARLAEMFQKQNEKARADLLGVLAERPEYKSVLGSDFQNQRDYAFGNAVDPGFLLQRGRENQNLSEALQASTRAQGGQTANAYSQLAMNGGLSSGARERIASSGASNGLLARQGLRNQSSKNLTDLGIAEEGQRFQTRGGVLQGQIQDNTNANNFAQENWKTRANTLAGLSQGEQQQTASLANRAQDKGACCFIFAEADALGPVVRRYRDEHMTELNRRGYYKLAHVLVPYMRHSRVVKNAVKLAMIMPLTAYGEWHYNKTGIGFIFKPIKNFWMRAFNFLGGEHKFIRDNGEIV